MIKPVELIVTTELHRTAEIIEQRPSAFDAASDKQRAEIMESRARQILCDIAHQAHAAVVLKALAAVGVAGGIDALAQRLAAVRESRADERRAHGIPEPDPAAPSNPIAEAMVDTIAKRLSETLGPGVSVTPIKVSGS